MSNMFHTPPKSKQSVTIFIFLATALVDEDYEMKEGSFDRMIGLYCGNDNIKNKKSINELLLEGGYHLKDFCGISEFASESWAQMLTKSIDFQASFFLAFNSPCPSEQAAVLKICLTNINVIGCIYTYASRLFKLIISISMRSLFLNKGILFTCC